MAQQPRKIKFTAQQGIELTLIEDCGELEHDLSEAFDLIKAHIPAFLELWPVTSNLGRWRFYDKTLRVGIHSIGEPTKVHLCLKFTAPSQVHAYLEINHRKAVESGLTLYTCSPTCSAVGTWLKANHPITRGA